VRLVAFQEGVGGLQDQVLDGAVDQGGLDPLELILFEVHVFLYPFIFLQKILGIDAQDHQIQGRGPAGNPLLHARLVVPGVLGVQVRVALFLFIETAHGGKADLLGH
jgi:hypothetical protein